MNIPRGKFGYLIECRGIPEYRSRGLVIEHLKLLGSHDLEPVDDAFDAGVGIEVCVGDYFLLEGDVLGCPSKEDGT